MLDTNLISNALISDHPGYSWWENEERFSTVLLKVQLPFDAKTPTSATFNINSNRNSCELTLSENLQKLLRRLLRRSKRYDDCNTHRTIVWPLNHNYKMVVENVSLDNLVVPGLCRS